MQLLQEIRFFFPGLWGQLSQDFPILLWYDHSEAVKHLLKYFFERWWWVGSSQQTGTHPDNSHSLYDVGPVKNIKVRRLVHWVKRQVNKETKPKCASKAWRISSTTSYRQKNVQALTGEQCFHNHNSSINSITTLIISIFPWDFIADHAIVCYRISFYSFWITFPEFVPFHFSVHFQSSGSGQWECRGKGENLNTVNTVKKKKAKNTAVLATPLLSQMQITTPYRLLWSNLAISQLDLIQSQPIIPWHILLHW